MILGLKENIVIDIICIYVLVYWYFCIFCIILILLLIKMLLIYLVCDILLLVLLINNCFDIKFNVFYFWWVVFLYDIIFVWYRKFGGNILLFGGNIFFKFDIYLFIKFLNDFEKWLIYLEWMMIGVVFLNVIELILVWSWSKVLIFMCCLVFFYEVIWKWINFCVFFFCEIIK